MTPHDRFDYSYTGILSNMLLWLCGQPDLALLEVFVMTPHDAP